MIIDIYSICHELQLVEVLNPISLGFQSLHTMDGLKPEENFGFFFSMT